MEIWERWKERSHAFPEKIALVDEKRSLTWKDFYNEWLILRKRLASAGIEQSSPVIIHMDNSVEWVLLLHALLSIGAVIVPIASQAKEDFEYAVKNVNAMHIFRSHEDIASLPDTQKENPAWPREDGDALYQLTSGSTGQPKICVRTRGQLLAEAQSYEYTLQLSEKDWVLNALPLSHSYTFGFTAIASLFTGATVSLIRRFTPRGLIRRIIQEKATVVPLVPALARQLTEVYFPREIDTSSVRIWIVGAGKLSHKVSKNFRERFGRDLFTNYGSTETGGVLSRLSSEPADAVGRPMYGVKVKITDEKGCSLPTGSNGEIWVKCASRMRGYLYEQVARVDVDDYISMGDIGYQDEQGYVYVTGRLKNVIKIGGKQVNPQETEEILLSIEGVMDAVVWGQMRTSGEPILRAWVVLSQGITIDEIKICCYSILESHKIPTLIEPVEYIPRNELGKVLQKELI